MFHSRSYLKCRLNTMLPLFLPITSFLELLLVNKLRCGETTVKKNSSFTTVTFFFIYSTDQSVIVSTRQKVINKTLCCVQLTSGKLIFIKTEGCDCRRKARNHCKGSVFFNHTASVCNVTKLEIIIWETWHARFHGYAKLTLPWLTSHVNYKKHL